MSPCLTESQIERLAGYRFDPEVEDGRDQPLIVDRCPQAWQEHVKECSNCQNAVENERLLADLKEAFEHSPHGSSTAESMRVPPDLDESFADGYRIIEEVHRGGQGIVYKVVQLATNRLVALKVLLYGEEASEQQKNRFEREINIAASLRHPNIVTIYDSGSFQQRRFLAMEFIDGRTLDQCPLAETSRAAPQASRFRSKRPFEEQLVLFAKIASAVGFAHTRGVIHRDLKPRNIMVDADNEPHVLDFGLAKLSDSLEAKSSPTLEGEFLGTLAYASPEQTIGDPERIDVRTDVYSLGVILYERLTGSLPYDIHGGLSNALENIRSAQPKQPSQVCRLIDDELETILLKALSKEPDRRYQSAGHFAQDIQQYLSFGPIDAKRDSGWYLLRKSLKRYRAAMTVIAAFVTVLAVALVVSLAALGESERERKIADQATLTAQLAAQEADYQRRQSQVLQAEAEFQSYVANLAAASGALRFGDVVEAKARLDATAPALRGWEYYELLRALDESQISIDSHTSYVTDVEAHPTRPLIASAGYDAFVLLSDSTTGELIAKIDTEERPVIRFTPDGKYLAIGEPTGNVRFWDLDRKRQDSTLHFAREAGKVKAIDFAQTGSLMAVAYEPPNENGASTAVLWDLGDASVRVLEERAEWHIEKLDLSDDGSLLATVGFDGARVWDIDDGSLLAELADQPGAENCVAVSHDNRLIATAGQDNLIHLWDVDAAQYLDPIQGHSSPVLDIAFAADNARVISASRDKTVRITDLQDPMDQTILLGHQWAVSSVAVSPAGPSVVSGSWDKTVKLWRPRGSEDTLLAHRAKVASVAFDAEGRRFATASWDKTITVWDAATRQPVRTLEGHTQPAHCVAFSPDGLSLLSGGWGGQLILWDVATGQVRKRFRKHAEDARVHAVAFNADGTQFLSGSSNNELFLWETASGKVIYRFYGHDDHIHSLALSPDNTWFASAGHQSVRVWDLVGREEMFAFGRRMVQEDYSLAIHPNSQWLAAGSNMQLITVWDIDVGASAHELVGHSDEIHAVVYSPDGSRLVSAAFDDRVKVWDAAGYRELTTLYGYSGHVTTLAFSPQGDLLVGGLDSGRLKIWNGLPPEDRK